MTSGQSRIAAFGAVTLAIAAWLVIAGLHIADGGFYSDDWAIQWEWDTFGYPMAVDRQFDLLGSKPLLAFLLPARTRSSARTRCGICCLPGCSALSRSDVLLRPPGLRFETRDAIPIALLALLFPWAMTVKVWPTGSLNNVAILLLFGAF